MGAALVLLLVALGAMAAGVLIGRYYVPDDRQLRRTARHSRAYMRALSHLIARDHDTVMAELRAIVEENVEDVEPYFALGALFRSRGEHERAIRVHQALAVRERERRKLRHRAMYELGLDFRAAGMPRRATRALERVVIEEPAHEGALRALASLYEEQARFNEAAGMWQRLGRRRGEDMSRREHHLLVAAAQAALGRDDLDSARQLLKSAQKLEESAHFFAAAAELAAARGNHRGARERLKQALVADPALVPHLLPGVITAEQGLVAQERAGRKSRQEDDFDDASPANARSGEESGQSHALALPLPASTSGSNEAGSGNALPASTSGGSEAGSGNARALALPPPAATVSPTAATVSPTAAAAAPPAATVSPPAATVSPPAAAAAPMAATASPTAATASPTATVSPTAAAAAPTAATASPTTATALPTAPTAPAATTEAPTTAAPSAPSSSPGALIISPSATAVPAGLLLSTLSPPPPIVDGVALVPSERPAASVAERVLALLAEVEAQSGPRLELALIRAQLVPPADAAAQAELAADLVVRFPDSLAARVAAARLAIARGDAGAIRAALDGLVSDGGALAWTLRGRWQCAHCGYRPGPFSWRCAQCRRWATLRMETGIEPPPVAPRERRTEPRGSRTDGLLGIAPDQSLPAATLDAGLSEAELATAGARRSLLGRVGGWFSGVLRRDAS